MSFIYSVTLSQTLNVSNPLNNVFFYRVDTSDEPDAAADRLGEAFEAEVLPAINNVQVDEVINGDLEIFNLFDPLDIATVGLTGTGAFSENVNDATISVGFRSNRERRDIRRGGKRIGGLPDNAVANNTIQLAILTNLAALQNILASPIQAPTDPEQIDYEPVVVKRIFTGVVNGKRQYRLPETELEAQFFFWTSTQTSLNARTQKSRNPDPVWSTLT